MRYYLTGQTADGRVSYDVFDADLKAGSFSYRLTEDARFYIEEIRLEGRVDPERTFRAVIQFLEYKAAVGADGSVYVRVDEKNHYLIHQYLEYGFYSIDTEDRKDAYGRRSRIIVLRNR